MRLAFGAVLCSLVLIAGCEPPGKPEAGPGEDAKVMDFKTLFAGNCSGCHGPDGQKGPGRILNDPLYLAVIPKEALQQVIEEGRPGTAMPPWAMKHGGPLDSGQISALVNGMEQNWAKPVDLKGAALPAYSASGDGDADRGSKLFQRDCFACHVTGGLAGPVNDGSYLALTTNQNLRTSIIVGRPDLGMPDYRMLNIGKPLKEQDLLDLVTYLAALRPAPEMVSGSQGGMK